MPKYFPHDRWHIERWTPPEFYGSPEIWYAQTIEVEDGIRIPALGPYPARGEYEHCFTLERANGEFLPLNPSACDWIVRAIEWSRRQPRARPAAPAISTAPRMTFSATVFLRRGIALLCPATFLGEESPFTPGDTTRWMGNATPSICAGRSMLRP